MPAGMVSIAPASTFNVSWKTMGLVPVSVVFDVIFRPFTSSASQL